MKKLFVIVATIVAICCAQAQFVVEWDKIEHWSGEGPYKAALLVQFADGGAQECYVWGYRWDPEHVEATGEDMMRAVATECHDLTLFTQYTGWMGNTVCGIGYSKDCAIAACLTYNFEGAVDDERVSFDYWTPNELMGQTSAPGTETQSLCDNALLLAADTHIIDHPINASRYGYAAYDYDWWQPDGQLPADMRWHAGWYNGYWSYWVGSADSKTLSYSGLGMTSRKLTDECVDAWCYNHIEGEYVDGVTGASSPSYPLNYHHFLPSGIKAANAEDACVEVYTIGGMRLDTPIERLPRGIYIIRKGETTNKLIIN